MASFLPFKSMYRQCGWKCLEKISLELTSSLNNLDNSLRIGSTNWIWPPENPTTRGTISDSSVTGPKSWHVGKVPKKSKKKIVKLAQSFLCPQQFDKFHVMTGNGILARNHTFINSFVNRLGQISSFSNTSVGVDEYFPAIIEGDSVQGD